MDTQTALLTNVIERPVTRRDGGTFTIYEIETSTGTYRIRRDMLGACKALVGAQIEIVGRTVTNDRGFTDNFADYVGISEIQPNAAEQAMAAAKAQQTQQQQQPIVTQTEATPTTQSDYEERKNASIHRQVAAKVAAHINAASPAPAHIFWANVESLFTYFQTGVVPAFDPDLVGVGAGEEEDGIPF